MSRWLALAEGAAVNTQTPPDNMTKPDKTPSIQPEGAFCQVLSNCQVREQDEGTAPKSTDDMRHGFALNDGHSPKTWTGKIVSLGTGDSFPSGKNTGRTGGIGTGSRGLGSRINDRLCYKS